MVEREELEHIEKEGNIKNHKLLLFIPQASEGFLALQQHTPNENLSYPQEIQPPATHAAAH